MCEVALEFEAEAQRALDTASAKGAAYADVRFGSTRDEHVEVRNGVVAGLSDSESSGFSVRALVDGAWGFASSALIEAGEIDRVSTLAVDIARASRAVQTQRIELDLAGKFIASYATPVQIDPSTVSTGERVAYLLDVDKEMRAVSGVTVSRAWIDIWHTRKSFASTEGSRIEQQLVQCGSALSALAVGAGDVQDRVHPGTGGLYQTGGYEVINDAKLLENARRVGEEAVALLTADQSPSGTADLVLSGDQMSLQIHESIGHALELDRVLGWEANFSGTSFATLDKLNTFRYGSDIVTVVCDMTCPKALATEGYDDEGTPATSVDLIRDGILVGYMAGRDTAAAAHVSCAGVVRAEYWGRLPMIRIGNVNLMPGTAASLDELFDGIKQGIYMESNRSWSIDDKRLNFQFGCQIGYEIKNGKRGRLLKNPTYAGMTPEFWASCDAIGDQSTWVAWGTPNCGKGEPLQTARSCQASSPARFRNVKVGVGYGG
ncbi:MAG: TldD/PmbA family protein [Candidatus Eremiobacteraeota bacterium]|nr:TldD/PmbA family protein [Candidatus Eremiobacteraeota bacterium]